MCGSPLRIFGRTSSSNTQKVLWMLHEVGRPFELVPASARLGADSPLLSQYSGAKPFGVVDTEDYRRICPTGQIPTLQDGDLAIWESHSILRYLAERYQPALHLTTSAGMARCSPWMDWVLASGFNLGCNHHLVDQIARTPPEHRDFQLLRTAHEGYASRLQLAEQRLAATGAYLAGDRFTVADIPLGAELSRWSCGYENWAREARRGAAPQPPPPRPEVPHLQAYFQRLQARPAFIKGCFSHEREHHRLPAVAPAAEPVALFGEELSE